METIEQVYQFAKYREREALLLFKTERQIVKLAVLQGLNDSAPLSPDDVGVYRNNPTLLADKVKAEQLILFHSALSSGSKIPAWLLETSSSTPLNILDI